MNGNQGFSPGLAITSVVVVLMLALLPELFFALAVVVGVVGFYLCMAGMFVLPCWLLYMVLKQVTGR